MAKHHHRRHMRQKIADMVLNIEAVMLNINNVLSEVSVLVNDIDSITERLEYHYGNKLRKPEAMLDANSNRCIVKDTTPMCNQSKMTTPSPYMDYTFLDLANDCVTCHDNAHSFTYNEKYPLWIQYDTWKVDHSISEISEVSTGSETQYGSDDKSWRSISNLGRNNNYIYHYPVTYNTKSKFDEEDVVKFSKCCRNSHNDVSDAYCGVYEQIMEQQLEDMGQLSLTTAKDYQIYLGERCPSDDLEELTECEGFFSHISVPTRLKNVTVRELSESYESSSES